MPVRLTSRDALRIFDIADIWASRARQEVRLVSANDHVHSRSSAHYAGVALDLHSSDPAGLAAALTRAGYRVLWNVPGHYGHVHAQSIDSARDRPRPLGLQRPHRARPPSVVTPAAAAGATEPRYGATGVSFARSQ